MMLSFNSFVEKLIAGILLTLLLPAVSSLAAVERISLEVSDGTAIELSEPAVEVFVADPDIADVQINSPNIIYVFGKRAGTTRLFVLGEEGGTLKDYELTISPNLNRLNATLKRLLPEEAVELHAVDDGVAIQGEVSTGKAASDIMSLVSGTMGDEVPVINMMSVTEVNQINLRVRVAEVSREVTDELGINWENFASFGNFGFGLGIGRDIINDAGVITRAAGGAGSASASYTSGDINANAMIDALQQENLVSILAEPNLTAMSGESASFLAGGEFPIPVSAEEDRISIEFKEFGVRLDFTPTLIGRERINLRVRPEVSEITSTGAVEIEGVAIPALSTRRADTTVTLQSGQSFVIAGLLQNNMSSTVDKFPGLGDLPILGGLFSSQNFRRNQSELIIIVTPYVVKPVAGSDLLSTPVDGLRHGNSLERLLQNRTARSNLGAGDGRPTGPNGLRLKGNAGFILE
ncbi:type II and III secretion system protein family protein [Fodinicurvata sediminis]|uniref:type II and III secretion system protein family protein n=1 Tax=Fodinicurvata sediminis TaxID=1121832 RepID=UPI0003F8ECD1|nr:type II and III secretion system protein family protein [Fodinicurvata sediminis]